MTFVFDLDHTLCDTRKTSEGRWDYLGAAPYERRIAKVNALYDEGHTIIIETARGCNSGKDWYSDTFDQLIRFGLKFHDLKTGRKPAADYYVDDKAIPAADFFHGIDH